MAHNQAIMIGPEKRYSHGDTNTSRGPAVSGGPFTDHSAPSSGLQGLFLSRFLGCVARSALQRPQRPRLTPCIGMTTIAE
jgi:hypothetical protein